MSEQETNTNQSASSSSSSAMNYVIALVVLVALGGGLWWYLGQDKDTMLNDSDNTSQAVDLSYPDVVARVNGTEISGDALLTNVNQTVQLQGVDISDATVKAQVEQAALDALINTEVILQAAAAANIVATDEQITAQLSEVTAQLGGEEGLAAQMELAGISMDDLRKDIGNQVVINAYLEQYTSISDLEATDEEIQAYYDNLASQSPEGSLPVLEDVSVQIQQQIMLQKQQVEISDLIDSLRSAANIEILI